MMAIYIQGPSGGNGGTFFNDAQGLDPHARITNLSFTWDNNAIRKITTKFAYQEKKKETSHGGDSGTHTVDIVTDDEQIEISSVTLYTDNYDGGRVVGIIIKTSNSQEHKIGKETNTKSCFDIPDGYKLIAFCGRANVDIDALGVVYQKKEKD